MAKPLPLRSDVVGSYLRPAYLHQARRDFNDNKINKKELTRIEDKAVIELVEQQKTAGLKVITDGEFRRRFWHIDFLENLHGIEGYVPEQGYNQTFQGAAMPSYNIRVTDKISFNNDHPFLTHFKFLKNLADANEDVIAKATIPSPTMVLRQELLAKEDSESLREIYPNLDDFYADLIQTYCEVINAFYATGCRYLQFDDTNWAFLADANKRISLQEKGIDGDEIANICTDIINGALANKPDDMIITTHICRGNHASSWLFSGGYEPIAEALFATEYDGFFLEYDNERAGDFAPLRYWQQNGSRVVLGLITSKFAQLEDKELVKTRIAEAAEYVPLSNLCLSPQCGFASTEQGNNLSIDEQWQKIRLNNEIANEVWQGD